MTRPGGLEAFGTFEMLGLLGRGGMAEVFKVRPVDGPWAGRELALKRLLPELQNDPEYLSLFATEADLSRQLDHPNIVTLHEVGAEGDVYYLLMELIDGRDGGAIIKRCQKKKIPWPVDFAVYLTRVLLDALAYAHQATGVAGEALNIVHCDVSPSNLFISRTGDIKLGDFGVARARIDAGAESVMGKPYYLSPEMLTGSVSPAGDLWAATVTLYELLTLRRPFTGKNPDEVFKKIRAREYPKVRSLRPEISPELAAVVEKGFAATPEERFADAAEYAAALGPLYDERVGTPLAISAVVRGLFGTQD